MKILKMRLKIKKKSCFKKLIKVRNTLFYNYNVFECIRLNYSVAAIACDTWMYDIHENEIFIGYVKYIKVAIACTYHI